MPELNDQTTTTQKKWIYIIIGAIFIVLMILLIATCGEDEEDTQVTPPPQGTEQTEQPLEEHDYNSEDLQNIDDRLLTLNSEIQSLKSQNNNLQAQVDDLKETLTEEIDDQSQFSGWTLITWIMIFGIGALLYMQKKNNS